MSSMSKRWLETGSDHPPQDVHTPDIEGMDYDQYNNSLSQ